MNEGQNQKTLEKKIPLEFHFTPLTFKLPYHTFWWPPIRPYDMCGSWGAPLTLPLP